MLFRSLHPPYDSSNPVFDQQAVPVLVSPQAPASIDLAASSDTGGYDTDNVTRRDNSSVDNKLAFTVSGVRSGAKVTLLDGDTIIGEVVATGTSATIVSNGTAPLSLGGHAIRARQTMMNLPLKVGNRDEVVNLESLLSVPLQLTIKPDDWKNPVLALDVDNDGVVAALDVLLIITEIDRRGARLLPATLAESHVGYVDVTGDGYVAAQDVLNVLTYLDQHAVAAAVPVEANASAVEGLNACPLPPSEPPGIVTIETPLHWVDPRDATSDPLLSLSIDEAHSSMHDSWLDAGGLNSTINTLAGVRQPG